MEAVLEAPMTSEQGSQHAEDLTVRAYYRPLPQVKYWMHPPTVSRWCYSRVEQDIILTLAKDTSNELSIAPVKGRDFAWETNGSSEVRRYELEDGRAGYFKPLQANSSDEGAFRNYGTSSLGASISELNAYRMAQLLGGSYTELVPTTVLRRLDGEVGTLQLEVNEPGEYSDESKLSEDYRRAALFDFVIGNLDRHSENYLFGADELGQTRIRLIDNSFSFPMLRGGWFLNESVFADNCSQMSPRSMLLEIPLDEIELREAEKVALRRARAGVEDWLSAGTIGIVRGKATLRRIDGLLELGRHGEISEYFDGLRR